jgi:hypothetical protein
MRRAASLAASMVFDENPAMADRRAWPWWVRLGMWGVVTDFVAWMYVWICVVAAVVCLVIGTMGNRPQDRAVLIGIPLFVLAGVWYYCCIRWIRRSGNKLEPPSK